MPNVADGPLVKYQKPNTRKVAKGHKAYPYLLRGLRATRPESGLGQRHLLPADATELSVSHSGHGLIYAKVLVWRISMDGEGRALPTYRFFEAPAGRWINIFLERFWRCVKYECIYPHA